MGVGYSNKESNRSHDYFGGSSEQPLSITERCVIKVDQTSDQSESNNTLGYYDQHGTFISYTQVLATFARELNHLDPQNQKNDTETLFKRICSPRDKIAQSAYKLIELGNQYISCNKIDEKTVEITVNQNLFLLELAKEIYEAVQPGIWVRWLQKLQSVKVNFPFWRI